MDKDISTLLQEIKAKTGWSEPRIASEIGTSQPTVNRILNGQSDCKRDTWKAIEALHESAFAEPASTPQKQNRSHDTPEQLRELEPAEMRGSDPKVAE